MIPAAPKVGGGVQYDPPVPSWRVAQWQRELDLIAPKSDVLSWLLIHWEPGDFWESNTLGEGFRPAKGIGRWVISQMTPHWRVPDFILQDLEGPNPRTFGWWNAREGVFEQRRSCAVNRTQWELFQRHRAYAKPYWVVQGTKGGHLRRYTSVQSKLAQMQGQPAEPPAPGDLPYAEPDRRTFAALARLDLVRGYDRCIAFGDRSPELVEAGEQAAVQGMREQLWNWLSAQTEDALSENRQFLRQVEDSLPVGVTEKEKWNLEAAHERFVTSN